MEKSVEEHLFSGEREAQIQAATELANLTSKQKHKLAERGVIVPLISMLHLQNYEAIEAALFALLSLAFGSERLVCLLLVIYITIVNSKLHTQNPLQLHSSFIIAFRKSFGFNIKFS